jgi:hypothetical protein
MTSPQVPIPSEHESHSAEALSAIDQVEALPYSIAFEHLMYDSRLDRTAAYEYAHPEDDTEDSDPIYVDPDIMTTRFPTSLRDSFPKAYYIISKLKITQVDEPTEGKKKKKAPASEKITLSMQFETDDRPHTFSVQDGVGRHDTFTEGFDPVSYPVTPEEALGLAASFVYARQYNPSYPNLPIELSEVALSNVRDPKTHLFEQIIMTLGDHSGHSSVETRAIFDSTKGSPIYAVLTEQEFPDKSSIQNTLQLNEVSDINDLPTSIETRLFQTVMNIEQASEDITAEKQSENYAEQSSTVIDPRVLNFPGIQTTEVISPKDFNRWAYACSHFLRIIKKPMKSYAHLDNFILE